MAGTTTPRRETAPPEPRRPSITLPLILLIVVAVLAALALVVRFPGDKTHDMGSGAPATDTRSVPSFTSVELAGSATVTVLAGRSQSVLVRADDNLIDRITTKVRGSTLVIDSTGSFTTTTPMSVQVTVPTLDAVRLSGSGRITVDDVNASQFTATLPGSGQLKMAGRADQLNASLEGSGDMDLSELLGRVVTAEVSGSGRIVVHATESLTATVSGSGAIFYGGHPSTVTKAVTGSGSIIGS